MVTSSSTASVTSKGMPLARSCAAQNASILAAALLMPRRSLVTEIQGVAADRLAHDIAAVSATAGGAHGGRRSDSRVRYGFAGSTMIRPRPRLIR